MTHLTVVVPAPCAWLAINDRDHWAARAAKVRAWRMAAFAAAKVRRLQPILGPVQVLATIHKSSRVQYDLDGTAATVKACIDGARDALLIDGDDSSVVTRLVIEPGEVRAGGCVVLTITPSRNMADKSIRPGRGRTHTPKRSPSAAPPTTRPTRPETATKEKS